MREAAERWAHEFLAAWRRDGVYLRGAIEELARLATDDHAQSAKGASRAVFTSLVEPLADAFDPQLVTVYNRAFAQMIDHCRKLPRGRALDEALNAYGLRDEEGLVARAERLRAVAPLRPLRPPRRVAILSRVTLGADVAVTSVLLERLKREFPEAQFVLVGGRKAAELFGGDARLRFAEVDYARGATLIERLSRWLDVRRAVAEIMEGLAPDEFLIVDPDSRLTQLGLLPVAESAESLNYLFFPSREYGGSTGRALGELAAGWLDELFGETRAVLPRISPARGDVEAGARLRDLVRAAGGARLVTVNFGVGENPAKRLGDEFEIELVARLLARGAAVILDKGAGEEEARRAARIAQSAARLNAAGHGVREFDEARLPELLAAGPLDARLLVWEGRIGLLAGFICASDLYVGYDSAGQHIAAASGVPCVDICAGYSSPRIPERWRPTGPAAVRVVAVDSLHRRVDWRAVLDEVEKVLGVGF